MIDVGSIKYSIFVKAASETGWFREMAELEVWCKENMGDKCYITKPTPRERVFVFDNAEDAMAFRLTWQE